MGHRPARRGPPSAGGGPGWSCARIPHVCSRSGGRRPRSLPRTPAWHHPLPTSGWGAAQRAGRVMRPGHARLRCAGVCKGLLETCRPSGLSRMESAVLGLRLWVRRVQPCWVLQGADTVDHALEEPASRRTVFYRAPRREGVRLSYHGPCGGGQPRAACWSQGRCGATATCLTWPIQVMPISTKRAREVMLLSSSWQINSESITGGIAILLFSSEARTARVFCSEPMATQRSTAG
jgi:hypothetical protein